VVLSGCNFTRIIDGLPGLNALQFMGEKTMLVSTVRAALVAVAVIVATPLQMAQAEQAQGRFGDYTPSGFLSSYDKLVVNTELDDSFIYRYTGKDAAKYTKIIIDPIQVYFADDPAANGEQAKQMDPADLKALTDYFREALVTAFGDEYPVVDVPGPDTLRLRIAITNLVANKPAASVLTLAVPFLWLADAGTGVAQGKTGSTMFVGEASVEMEVMDSESNQQLAAFIETRVAKKYNWTEGVQQGVGDYLRAYTTWAYTKEAMDHWARMLRERMDAAHGKAATR
jgi:hypothetical protein